MSVALGSPARPVVSKASIVNEKCDGIDVGLGALHTVKLTLHNNNQHIQMNIKIVNLNMIRIFFLLVTIISQPVYADHFPTETELQSIFSRYMEKKLPTNAGAILGVMEADGRVKIVSVGSSGNDGKPINKNSIFEIGSITKVFTSVALVEMVRQGDVKLLDPVSTYLPDTVKVPSKENTQIKLIDLSTHSSGLPRLPSNMPISDPSNPYFDYTYEQLYAFLSNYKLKRKIGHKVRYSNLGFGLLGHALSNANGTSFHDLITEKVLTPLDMRFTGVKLTPQMQSLIVKGHNKKGIAVSLWDLPTMAGAGALRSNMTDMLKFLAANISEPDTKLIKSIHETHSPQLKISNKKNIGLAWGIGKDQPILIGHSGGTGGFSSLIAFDPKKKVGLVLLSNTNKSSVLKIGYRLLSKN